MKKVFLSFKTYSEVIEKANIITFLFIHKESKNLNIQTTPRFLWSN